MLSVGYKETEEALGSFGDADKKKHTMKKRDCGKFLRVFKQ